MEYLFTGETLYLNYDGKRVVLRKGDRNYYESLDLLKQGNFNEIKELLEVKVKTVEEYVEGSGLQLINGRLYDAENKELPTVLNNRMQELRNQGFSITCLVSFWNNLKKNPSLNSREMLYKFLEHNGHPLTEDGYFIAYRGVTEDFKDWKTRTFDNHPGSVCEMPREEVDDNPNNTCSKGLHVAAYDYAKTFASRLIEVKVNPMDVVSVPTDYNGTKMRVCRFEVICECEGLQETPAYDTRQYVEPVEEDESLQEWQIEDILNIADEYKERYTDRSTLALRVQEDLDEFELADILKVLNENDV